MCIDSTHFPLFFASSSCVGLVTPITLCLFNQCFFLVFLCVWSWTVFWPCFCLTLFQPVCTLETFDCVLTTAFCLSLFVPQLWTNWTVNQTSPESWSSTILRGPLITLLDPQQNTWTLVFWWVKLSTRVEAEQLWLNVSAAAACARINPPNLTTQERRTLTSLSKDPDIAILLADKGSTVILNTAQHQNNITTLFSDNTVNEALKWDLTNSYKKKVIRHLPQLEKEVIDCPTYYKLYPGEAVPRIVAQKYTKNEDH